MIKDINNNIKKDYHYFIFLHKEEDEKAICIHVEKWLLSAFLKTFIQWVTIYWIKVNNIKFDFIIDLMTNKVIDHTY